MEQQARLDISVGQTASRGLTVTAEMNMPGAGTVFTKRAWMFLRTVFIGDTIRAEATALSVHPRWPMTDMSFTVTNPGGEDVLKGEAVVFQAAPVG
jgi:acyl dehydratase